MKADVAKHRHELIEKIAENDDTVMSAYLDGKEISIEDLRKTLRKAVITGKIVPVPGGVLIRDDAGCIVGAIGISGETSDNDELCAVAGIQAGKLVADTGG